MGWAQFLDMRRRRLSKAHWVEGSRVVCGQIEGAPAIEGDPANYCRHCLKWIADRKAHGSHVGVEADGDVPTVP